MKKLILVLLLIFSTFNAYAYERPADSEIKKITMVGEILAIEKKDGSVLITNLLTPKLDDDKQNETSSTPKANNDKRISDNLDLEGISKPASPKNNQEERDSEKYVAGFLRKYPPEVRDKQVWIMEHVSVGTKWNLDDMFNRFGIWEQYPPKKGNPDIIQMFYFKDIDVTFMVNMLKMEIQTYRFGKHYD